MNDFSENPGPRDVGLGLTKSEITQLKQSPLFSDLKGNDICRFYEFIARRSFEKDALIIEQDTPGDSLFILISGRLKVFRRGEYDEMIVLGDVLPGESIGEMGFFRTGGDRPPSRPPKTHS